MVRTLIYVYDAYCGWCFGFSPVIQEVTRHYASMPVEVLSGGMMRSEKPIPISRVASYVQVHYRQVEEKTKVRFGQDYLWHIFHPEQSDWFLDSLPPAIALCIFKDYYPDRQVEFASDLQWALHVEGRDLTDPEAYRHLLKKYDIPEKEFYEGMKGQPYREMALAEFDVVRRLQVQGFPTLLLRERASKYQLLTSGYLDYPTLARRIEQALHPA